MGQLIKDDLPYTATEQGDIIPGGSKIMEIINTALNSSTYTAIVTTKPSKQIQVTTSDGSFWKLSNIEAGTTNQRIPANTVINLAGGFRAGTLFFALASAGTPNLEVTVID